MGSNAAWILAWGSQRGQSNFKGDCVDACSLGAATGDADRWERRSGWGGLSVMTAVTWCWWLRDDPGILTSRLRCHPQQQQRTCTNKTTRIDDDRHDSVQEFRHLIHRSSTVLSNTLTEFVAISNWFCSDMHARWSIKLCGVYYTDHFCFIVWQRTLTYDLDLGAWSTPWVKKECHPNHGYNFVNSSSICKIPSLLQRAVSFQKNILGYPPHLKCVAALPWKT